MAALNLWNPPSHMMTGLLSLKLRMVLSTKWWCANQRSEEKKKEVLTSYLIFVFLRVVVKVFIVDRWTDKVLRQDVEIELLVTNEFLSSFSTNVIF